MKPNIFRGLIPILFIVFLHLFCLQTVEPDLGELTIRLDRSQPALNRSSAAIHQIRITVQPGEIVSLFGADDTTLTIELDLGFYNVTAEMLDQTGAAVYTGQAQKVLVESFKTTSIEIPMAPNFPSEAPEFTGLQSLNVNTTGDYTLTWTPTARADRYRLEESDDSTFVSPDLLYQEPDTSHAVTGRSEGTRYYRVRGENDVDVSPWSRTIAFRVEFTPELAITTDALERGQAGIAYSQTLSATGGTPPFAWAIVSGEFPEGLSLDAATGEIAGTPEESGEWSFTVEVTDSGDPAQTDTKQFDLTIAPSELTIASDALEAGQASIAYAQTLSATGGTPPYAWTVVSGALPEGLSLDAATGEIAGTPEESGEWSFTVEVTDSGDPAQTDTKQFDLTITPPTLTVTTSTLADGQANSAYSQTLAAQGGTPPYTWAVVTGSLPGGLSLNSATGEISGTPTSAGTSQFTVEVTDSGTPALTDTRELTVTIAPPPLTLTTPSPLPDGTQGVFYSQNIDAEGGSIDWTWSMTAGTLPSGIAFSDFGETGRVQGTPTESGTFDFTVQVTDNVYPELSDTRSYSLTVNAASLNITTSALPGARVGSFYNRTLNASGGTTPYTWSLASGSLPFGLNLYSSTGRISGTPSAADSWTFTVQVTDSGDPAQTDTRQLTINVEPEALEITTPSPLPDCKAGADYYVPLNASGGIPPYTWTLTSRSPAGFAEGIDLSADGVLSGDSNIQPETGELTVQVQDSGSPAQTDTKIFELTITAADLELFNSYLPDGEMGVEYWGYILYRGGTTPLESPWTITGDFPPPGISASYEASNSQLSLSGTPTEWGTYNFSVTVFDSGAPQQSRTDSFTIIINP